MTPGLRSPQRFPPLISPSLLTQQIGVAQQPAGQCGHDARAGTAAKVLAAPRELGVDLALQAANAAPQGDLQWGGRVRKCGLATV